MEQVGPGSFGWEEWIYLGGDSIQVNHDVEKNYSHLIGTLGRSKDSLISLSITHHPNNLEQLNKLVNCLPTICSHLEDLLDLTQSRLKSDLSSLPVVTILTRSPLFLVELQLERIFSRETLTLACQIGIKVLL